MGDILTNIDLAGTMFVAPMLRVRFRGSGNTEFPEGEPDGTEAPVGGAEPATPTPTTEPITPENPGGQPEGDPGSQPFPVHDNLHEIAGDRDAMVKLADGLIKEFNTGLIEDAGAIILSSANEQWWRSKMESVFGSVGVRVPTGDAAYLDIYTQMKGVLSSLDGYSVGFYNEVLGSGSAKRIEIRKVSSMPSGAESASNLADVSDNSEARTIQNKPC